MESSQFRCPHVKKQVHFDSNLKPSIFRPLEKYQVNSDPDTEIKSSSIPNIEVISISTTYTET